MANMKDLNRFVQKGTVRAKKVPVKAGSWLANAMKSVGLSARDIVKEAMPNTIDLASSAGDVAQTISESISDLGSAKNRVGQAFDANVYTKLVKDGLKNALEDLKSGDFYNQKRFDKSIQDFYDSDDDFDFGGGFDDDFDMGFDDDDEDFDADITSDDGEATASIKKSSKGKTDVTHIKMVNNIGPDSPLIQAINFSSQVSAKATGVIVDSANGNTKALATLITNNNLASLKLLTQMNDSIVSVNDSLSGIMSKHNAIAEQYYTDSMAVFNKIYDAIGSLRSGIPTGLADSPTEAARPENLLDMFMGAAIDKDAYVKNFKKNLNRYIDSNLFLSEFKSQVSDVDTWSSYVATPLRSITQGIANQMIPALTKEAMSKFDEMLGEFGVGMLTKIGSWSESTNPVLSTLGQIFGVRNKMNTTVNRADYVKGAVPFDGITHRTINDVIPTYLRQITAALTGREEFAFDYNKGRYRTLRSIQDESTSDMDYAKLSNFSDYTNDFDKTIRDTFTGMSKDDIANANKGFKRLIKSLVDNGGVSTYRMGKNGIDDPLVDELGVDDQTAQLVRAWADAHARNGDRGWVTKFFTRLPQQARYDVSTLTAERSANPVKYNTHYFDNGLTQFDNSSIVFGKGRASGRQKIAASAGIVDIDTYGHKPTYYLREIYKTLLNGINVFPSGTIESTPNGTAPSNRYASAIRSLDNEMRDNESRWSTLSESNTKYESDISKGKLDINDVYNAKQLEAAIGATIQKNSSKPDKRPQSILEYLGNGKSTVAKWARKANEGISQLSSNVSLGLNAGSELMYNIIFGNEDGRKGFGAVVDYLISGMRSQFQKLSEFVDQKVLQPLDDALFGDQGVFAKLKASDTFKNVTDKFKKGKDYLGEFLFGKKITGADGKVERQGGLFSDTFNELRNAGTAVRASIFGKTTKDGKRVPADEDDSIVGSFRRASNEIASSIPDILGLNDRDTSKQPKNLRELIFTGARSIWSNTKDRFNEWTDLLLGAPSKSKNIESARDFINSFRADMTGKGGKVGASAVVGAVSAPLISSSIGALGSLFLPGGPIGGAILGAGLSFVSQSDTLKNFLFGPKDDNGRAGGIVSKDVINFFKEHGTGIKAGAIVGGLSGLGFIPWLWMPGGPIGGAVFGAGLSMAKKSGAFDQFLYGDGGDKENPTGGIVKKFKDIFGKDKNLKGISLDAATGAGVGLVGSFFLPGGPILGALLGSALSITLNTNKFKTLMFGDEEVDDNGHKTGKRTGGLFGKFNVFLQDKIFSPLAKTTEIAQANFLYFMETKVALPLQAAVAPITNKFREFGETFMDGFKNMFKSIQEKFHVTVTKPIGDAINEWLIKPLKSIAGNIFKAFTTLLGTIIAAPFAAIGGIGGSIYRNDKRRGANAASAKQIRNGASNAFDAFKTKGFRGGFKDAMSSLWMGAKNAVNPSVREEGAFSNAGVGRYATRGRNYDTIMADGLAAAKAKRDASLSRIRDKFAANGFSFDFGDKSKAPKAPKTDTRANTINDAKDTTSDGARVKTNASPLVNTVSDFKDSFNGFKDKVVSNLSDIRDRLVGAARDKAASVRDKRTKVRDSKPKNFKDRSPKDPLFNKKSHRGDGNDQRASVIVDDKLNDKVFNAKSPKDKVPNASSMTVNVSDTNMKHNDRHRTIDIASNVKDIADSVHGQLNGVGLNINKIYKTLIKFFGINDKDVAGDNNKAYVGFFGKIRTMFNRPVQAAFNFVLKPIRAIGGILNGVKDTMHTIWVGFRDGAKGLAKGAIQLGASLLALPVYITKIGYQLIKTLGPVVSETLVQGVKLLGTGLSGAAKILLDGIGTVTGVIRGAAKGFGDAIGGAISAVINLGKGLGVITKDIAGGIWKVLKDVASGAWGVGKTIIGGAIKGGLGIIGGLLSSNGVDGFGLARPVYVVGGTLDKVKELSSGTVRVEGGWLDYVSENRATSYSDSAEKSNDKTRTILKNILSLLKGGRMTYNPDKPTSDIVQPASEVPRIGHSSYRMNLNMFGERTNRTPQAGFNYPMVINSGSAIAVRRRFAEEDAAREQQESIFEVVNALRVQNTENKRHYTEWNKIFSLKNGILTFGALTLFNWLTKGNFANVILNISKKVLGLLPSVLKGLFDTLGNVIAGISDKGRNKELVVDPETGLPVTDENGNVQTVKRNGMASAFMPTETQIDPKTGEAKTSLKWRSTSGSLAAALGSRYLKWNTVGGVKIAAKMVGDSAINAAIGSAIGSTVKNTVLGTSAALKTVGGMAKYVVSKANSIPLVRNTVSPLVSSFISIATKTATFIKDKVLGFILQHGGKAGSKLLALLDDIASIGSKLTGNSAILDSFKAKITQCMGKLSGNGSAALITGGLTELALGAFGAINANPAQVFGVNAKDVDVKMQLIARFLRGLATTTIGSVVDLVCQIINAIKNTDVVQNLAVGIYNAISSDADSDKLSKARKAFDDEWKKYQDDQYTAYLKKCQETGTTPMGEEEFKAQAAITKQSYNEQQNKTIFATVASGVGNGIRTVKNFFAGNKTGASKNGLDAYNQTLNKSNDGNGETNASGDDGGQGATVVLDKDRLNNFPFLLQNDSRWGSQQYTSTGDSSQTIGSSGCGTTSMAMVLRSFGNNVTPIDTSSYSIQNGYRTANAGTGWGFFRSIGNQYGLTTEDLGKDTNAVAASLAAGKPIIASMGKGTFTKSGHFIVLSGTDSNGNILVNDPASTERSQKAWPLSVFANEGKNFWAFSKDGSGSIGNTVPVDAILSTSNGSYSSNVDSANMQGENSTGSSGKKSFTQLLSEFASAIFKPIGDALGISFGDDSSSDSSNVDFNDATSTTDANGNTINYTVDGDYVGKYVKQFESGSKGSAMISSGKGDYGGVSFGSYQFPTYGQAQASSSSNLAKFWSQYYGSQYSSTPGNNDAFKKDWTTAVEKDPAGFFNNEHKFVADLYYNPFVSKLKSAGVGDPGNNSRGAQDAAWSTAVQLGAGKSAVNKFVDAGVNESTDPETYLKKLYEQKISTVPQTFKSSSKSVQQSVADRYKNELNVLLPLAKEKGINPDVVGKGETEVNGKEVTPGAMAIPTKDTISGQSFTDNISNYSSEPNASGPRSIVNYGSVRYPSYKETNAAGTSGSSGTSIDLMNQVVTLLTTIANEITNISETVEGINKKPSTVGYIDNSVTNNNTVQTTTKTTPTKTYTDSAKNGRDRSGYAIAKQIAKGTFALA